jgi:hypothetical protein
MHVGFKRVNFNQWLELIHEFDGRLLSIDLLKLITRDTDVDFGKNIPHWKGNSTKKTIGHVSIDEFGP